MHKLLQRKDSAGDKAVALYYTSIYYCEQRISRFNVHKSNGSTKE